MDKLRRIVRKTRRKMKTVDIANVISVLETRGYDTVFFNTKKGDRTFEAYGFTDKDRDARGFTYCGNTRVVFVNGNISHADKLYSLLHELGHVMLGHFPKAETVPPDIRLSEMEAEAFAYAMLYPRFVANIF